MEVVRGAGALVSVQCGDGVTAEAGLVLALLLHNHLGGLVPFFGAGDSNTCLVIPDLSLQDFTSLARNIAAEVAALLFGGMEELEADGDTLQDNESENHYDFKFQENCHEFSSTESQSDEDQTAEDVEIIPSPSPPSSDQDEHKNYLLQIISETRRLRNIIANNDAFLKDSSTSKSVDQNEHKDYLLQIISESRRLRSIVAKNDAYLKDCIESARNTGGDMTPSKEFQCILCDHTYTMRRNLITHLDSHIRSVKFSCEHCGKPFRSKYDLKEHVSRTLGKCKIDRSMVDEYVEYEDIEPKNLKSEDTESRNKKYQCIICSKLFTAKRNLTTHMQSHDENRPRYDCNECHKSYSARGTLRDHIIMEHNRNSKFICENCEKPFRSNFVLKEHITRGNCKPKSDKVHTNVDDEEILECDDCNYVTHLRSGMRRHLRQVHDKVVKL